MSRRQAMAAIEALRRFQPGCESAKLRNFGMTLGIRDTRKIDAAYNLSGEDVRGEARFDERTRAELESLDAGTWFDARFRGTRIPTLDAALDVIQAGSMTLVERKTGDAKTLIDQPGKRAAAANFNILFLWHQVYSNMQTLMVAYWYYVVTYIAASAVMSFALCYYWYVKLNIINRFC